MVRQAHSCTETEHTRSPRAQSRRLGVPVRRACRAVATAFLEAGYLSSENRAGEVIMDQATAAQTAAIPVPEPDLTPREIVARAAAMRPRLLELQAETEER